MYKVTKDGKIKAVPQTLTQAEIDRFRRDGYKVTEIKDTEKKRK